MAAAVRRRAGRQDQDHGRTDGSVEKSRSFPAHDPSAATQGRSREIAAATSRSASACSTAISAISCAGCRSGCSRTSSARSPASILRPAQYSVLSVIAANRGLSQADVAQLLGIERARLVRLLDRLEQRGLTQRLASPVDRRSHALQLTPAGQALLKRARALAQVHEGEPGGEARRRQSCAPDRGAARVRSAALISSRTAARPLPRSGTAWRPSRCGRPASARSTGRRRAAAAARWRRGRRN